MLFTAVLLAFSALTAGCSGQQSSQTEQQPAITRTSLQMSTVDPLVGPASPPARKAADFAAAWVRKDLPADRWWAAIAPLCEPGFAEALRGTEPGTVPASVVFGRPVVLNRPAPKLLGLYRLTTDTGTLFVTVAEIDGRWLVTDNEFIWGEW
ncbi:hypothetical protein Drose_24885 [Dactylosporangium roseum]|uniref:Lipoprotein n=1 Tax=Dactylosporangium roseum TaxID=47989 RepID=A0ABY5Z031_9ACTN|nr:hypothetical protein [Dactylosporangium roseum]UWZ34453.1 hypothetical protein Drose_24885 [Dactylosporangium roseum]